MGAPNGAALISLVVLIALALPLPTDQAPMFEDGTELQTQDPYQADGCYYNLEYYEEGGRIVTNEPCLNCTCHNHMLMCYLRVCPFTKPIGQDCTIEKKPDQCCPVITCPEVPVGVQLVTSSTTPSPPTSALGHPDSYGCVMHDNDFYPDGAQLPSDPKKPCELCYCIRNHTACVMQECTLHVEGCTPVYQNGVCCPIRYDCDHDEATTPSPSGGLITTPGGPNECLHEGKVYNDGEMVEWEGRSPCEHCYCMRGDVVCAVQECGIPLRGGCVAVPPPPEKCCPDTFHCANETLQLDALLNQTGPFDTSLSTEQVSSEEKGSEEEKNSSEEKGSGEDKGSSESAGASSDSSEEKPSSESDEVIIQNPEEGLHQLPEQEHPENQEHPEHVDAVLEELASESPSVSSLAPESYTEVSVENVEIHTSTPEIKVPQTDLTTSKPFLDEEKPAEEGHVADDLNEIAHEQEDTEDKVPEPSQTSEDNTSADVTEPNLEAENVPQEESHHESTPEDASHDDVNSSPVEEVESVHPVVENEEVPIEPETGEEVSSPIPHEHEDKTPEVPSDEHIVPDSHESSNEVHEEHIEESVPELTHDVPESSNEVHEDHILEAVSEVAHEVPESTNEVHEEHILESAPGVAHEVPESTNEVHEEHLQEPVTEVTHDVPESTNEVHEEHIVESVPEVSHEVPESSNEVHEEHLQEPVPEVTPEETSEPEHMSEAEEHEVNQDSVEHTHVEPEAPTLEESFESVPAEPISSQDASHEEVTQDVISEHVPEVTESEKTAEVPHESISEDKPVEHESPTEEHIQHINEVPETDHIQHINEVSEPEPDENLADRYSDSAEHVTTESAEPVTDPTGTARLPGESICVLEGRTYTHNSLVHTTSPCQESCICLNSVVHCKHIDCPPPPPEYTNCLPLQEPDTCCPTYTCDVKPSVPLESHSQVSTDHYEESTEVPVVQDQPEEHEVTHDQTSEEVHEQEHHGEEHEAIEEHIEPVAAVIESDSQPSEVMSESHEETHTNEHVSAPDQAITDSHEETVHVPEQTDNEPENVEPEHHTEHEQKPDGHLTDSGEVEPIVSNDYEDVGAHQEANDHVVEHPEDVHSTEQEAPAPELPIEETVPEQPVQPESDNIESSEHQHPSEPVVQEEHHEENEATHEESENTPDSEASGSEEEATHTVSTNDESNEISDHIVEPVHTHEESLPTNPELEDEIVHSIENIVSTVANSGVTSNVEVPSDNAVDHIADKVDTPQEEHHEATSPQDVQESEQVEHDHVSQVEGAEPEPVSDSHEEPSIGSEPSEVNVNENDIQAHLPQEQFVPHEDIPQEPHQEGETIDETTHSETHEDTVPEHEDVSHEVAGSSAEDETQPLVQEGIGGATHVETHDDLPAIPGVSETEEQVNEEPEDVHQEPLSSSESESPVDHGHTEESPDISNVISSEHGEEHHVEHIQPEVLDHTVEESTGENIGESAQSVNEQEHAEHEASSNEVPSEPIEEVHVPEDHLLHELAPAPEEHFEHEQASEEPSQPSEEISEEHHEDNHNDAHADVAEEGVSHEVQPDAEIHQESQEQLEEVAHHDSGEVIHQEVAGDTQETHDAENDVSQDNPEQTHDEHHLPTEEVHHEITETLDEEHHDAHDNAGQEVHDHSNESTEEVHSQEPSEEEIHQENVPDVTSEEVPAPEGVSDEVQVEHEDLPHEEIAHNDHSEENIHHEGSHPEETPVEENQDEVHHDGDHHEVTHEEGVGLPVSEEKPIDEQQNGEHSQEEVHPQSEEEPLHEEVSHHEEIPHHEEIHPENDVQEHELEAVSHPEVENHEETSHGSIPEGFETLESHSDESVPEIEGHDEAQEIHEHHNEEHLANEPGSFDTTTHASVEEAEVSHFEGLGPGAIEPSAIPSDDHHVEAEPDHDGVTQDVTHEEQLPVEDEHVQEVSSHEQPEEHVESDAADVHKEPVGEEHVHEEVQPEVHEESSHEEVHPVAHEESSHEEIQPEVHEESLHEEVQPQVHEEIQPEVYEESSHEEVQPEVHEESSHEEVQPEVHEESSHEEHPAHIPESGDLEQPEPAEHHQDQPSEVSPVDESTNEASSSETPQDEVHEDAHEVSEEALAPAPEHEHTEDHHEETDETHTDGIAHHEEVPDVPESHPTEENIVPVVHEEIHEQLPSEENNAIPQEVPEHETVHSEAHNELPISVSEHPTVPVEPSIADIIAQVTSQPLIPQNFPEEADKYGVTTPTSETELPDASLGLFQPGGPFHPTWTQKPVDQVTTTKAPSSPHLPEDTQYPAGYEPDYEDEDGSNYSPGTCRYGGKIYLSAQQIPRDDPCDFCFCFRSDIICLQQSCPPPIQHCYQESIPGFCCPRYECHVSMATMVNVTTTTTTTTTTLPPHFLAHAYNGAATRTGCQVKGVAYRVGERIPSTSGPCLECRCGADGQMKCDPTVCNPQEALLRQVIDAAISRRR